MSLSVRGDHADRSGSANDVALRDDGASAWRPLIRLARAGRAHLPVLGLGVLLLLVGTLVDTIVIPVLFTALLMTVIGPAAVASPLSSWSLFGVELGARLSAWSGSADRVSMLWTLAGSGLLAMLAKTVCTAARGVLAHHFSFLVARDLRQRMFAALLAQSPDFYRRERTGDLVSRLTADVHLVHDNLGIPLFELMQAPLGLVLAFGAMLSVSWVLTLTTLCAAPAVAAFIAWATRLVRRLTLSRQAEYARLSGYIAERLGAVRLIQAFGRERHEVERMSAVDRSFFRQALNSVSISESLGPASELAIAAGMLAGLVVGGLAVLRGSMRPDQFVLFFALAPAATTQLGRFARAGVTCQQLNATSARVFAVVDAVPATVNRPGGAALAAPSGRVTFEHVTYSYEGRAPALCDVTLDIAPGTLVAIVGPSGAGKTTLVNLIPRFMDPDAGRVCIDGIDVRALTLESLRSHIGLVAQEAVLFSDSVLDNIRYARPDATRDEVAAAARAAHADEFIADLPQGLDTVLAERGQSMSAGQRQRIAIARALLRSPRILILDEATSSLDSTSERLVQEALERLIAGRTTLVIAHRLSTVQKADSILVVDQGRIVEQGTHDVLLRQGGLYRSLYEAQFRRRAKSETPS